ncbi:alpha/beta hydrolase [Undibacterium parvum]|uniref:Alpha/beta hydrolase n=1 Tax=Undibacterium parvum TaxID=401471 RepID=A0A3S9HQA8_9BURK|nr:alpha/beta hydrolase [Undibacterium parvum]AZP14267.1 alpha/beta hydrolase [Undibacterium parvum]
MKNTARSADYYSEQYNARANIPEHPYIFTRWVEQSAQVRRRHAGLFDLMYGESAGERLDLFPTRVANAPLLVFIHGGWWRSLDKSDFSSLAPAYTNAGMNVAMLNYSLAPEASIEEIVQQQLRALAWLYKNAERYEIDGERIILVGHSAGAHLAAMLMTANWSTYDAALPERLIKAAALLSGVYDLSPLLQTDFVNVDLKLTEERILPLSPGLMPLSQAIPFITAVGGLESDEFKRQTSMLEKHWKHQHHTSIALPESNHLTICDALSDPASALNTAIIGLAKSI